MSKYLWLFVNLAIALTGATTFAHEIHVETGAYDGAWWLWVNQSPQKFTGDVVVEVPTGDFSIATGTEAHADLIVDDQGVVSLVGPTGAGLVGGQNRLVFQPVEVSVAANGYGGNYRFGWLGFAQGDATAWVVPGMRGTYRIDFDHNVPGSELRFSVDGAGSVSLAGAYAPMASGGLRSLSFETTPVTIDPGDYTGEIRLTWGERWYGVNTVTLLRGQRRALGLPYDLVDLQVGADGSVSTDSTASAWGVGSTLHFATTPVTIGGASYDSTYYLVRHADGTLWRAGDDVVVLVPGLDWAITLASQRFRFHVEADGSVSGDFGETFDYFGSTLGIRTVPITIDPGEYSGLWQPAFMAPDTFAAHPPRTGPSTLRLPPGTYWRFLIAQARPYFELQLDGSGAIESAQPASGLVVSGQTAAFNTVPILVDPGAYTGPWYAQANEFYGPTELAFVAGFDWQIRTATAPWQFASVFDPCAVNPNALTFSDGILDFVCDTAPPDADGDGVPDDADNCPESANVSQIDLDGDGLGDVCDADRDGDGHDDVSDSCPDLPNAAQLDADGDGIGDACDSDDDGDSVPDLEDNCAGTANTDQADNDADGFGDACDDDDDDDGVNDADDNCVFTANPVQADYDGDGEGDACDGDSDADGVPNELDQCSETPGNVAAGPDGCSGPQLIDVQCNPASFSNHGRYVSCVARAVDAAVETGLLKPDDKGRFMRDAAKK